MDIHIISIDSWDAVQQTLLTYGHTSVTMTSSASVCTELLISVASTNFVSQRRNSVLTTEEYTHWDFVDFL